MTTRIRTLWLLGCIGFLAPAVGCVESTHNRRPVGGTSQACFDNQYFAVEWGIDRGVGTLPLSCADIAQMASRVQLITNAPPPDDTLTVAYGISCQDGLRCPDGSSCNMQGTTVSGLPAGTSIIEADLLSNSGAVLSYSTIAPADEHLYAVPSCDYLIAPFVFALN